jgi:hypothetical protein
VGVWGYDFGTSAHLAIELFTARGWDVILNDYLIQNVLFLSKFPAAGNATSREFQNVTRVLTRGFTPCR